MPSLRDPQDTNPSTLTIGRLAKAAEVGIETIRYYQARGLLPPPPTGEGYRQYPVSLVQRIRFVKRAQELGFSLDEIGSLLQLQDGTNRKAIRSITRARLEQISTKLADLERMRSTLNHLLHECESHAKAAHCPIIDSLSQTQTN